ncbi:hypothetical protein GCM10028808_12930 [Spirosoma migulaei]
MGAIRLIQKPQNGQITFKVPDEMRDEPIIIEFRPAKEESSQPKGRTLAEASQAFFAKLNRVKTDFREEDYNVYEQ